MRKFLFAAILAAMLVLAMSVVGLADGSVQCCA